MKTAAFSAAELRFGAEYPGPRICRTFTRKGAAVSSQRLPEIAGPLGGRPKAEYPAGSFARRSAKADCPARTSPRRSAKADCSAGTSSRRSAKADHAARTSSRRSGKVDHAARTSPRRRAKADCAARTSPRRSAKADYGGRLCPGGAFSAARPAGTARFLITRGKASFYETATFGRRKSFFVRRFVACFFARPERNWRCRRGKSPPPRNPGRPAAAPPNDRDRLPVFAPPARTPAPATPPQSACSRRRSGRPQRPNLFGRRLPESPKGKGKGKEEARMERAPPL